jgi:hypothetical protein
VRLFGIEYDYGDRSRRRRRRRKKEGVIGEGKEVIKGDG